LMILQDRELMQEIIAAVKAERMNVAYVVRRAFLAKAHYLESLSSEVFRARAADVRDVQERLLSRLLGRSGASIANAPHGSIVVAREIAPSETAALSPEGVVALVTQQGTLMSHVTILSRSRGVPAVIGVEQALERIPHGAPLLIDGERGQVICWPDEADIRRHHTTRERERRIGRLLSSRDRGPAATHDGRRVPVGANLERPEDAAAARESGAEGVGLFRTEFLFMNADSIPGEEAQWAAYQEVVRNYQDAMVTIRTLDLGGDKVPGLIGIAREENPFLGLRGIRFCLEHPELFLSQVRALLRAAVGGNLRLLLPMVSGIGELRETRAIIARAADQLRDEGYPIPARVPVGVMIEVPSAVWMSDALAREADYFSIGSNDLIQYCLAVDRGNAHVAHLYDALDPAFLRALDLTVRNAHAAGIRVGSCGEMSGELPGLLLLVGLGVDELSVAPFLIARTKAILAGVEVEELRGLAGRCLEAAAVEDVRRIVREGLRVYPQFLCEEREGSLTCFWDPERD
ncbi:MAG: phosphoenolpyruvate--protein phosphotransferase, partial [Candidatus Eisenbacteria bacterium]